MTDHTVPPDAPEPEPDPVGDGPGSWDDALCRLEDVLLALPTDRALPVLDDLLGLAGVTRTFLEQDERAGKLLGEAMLARPFGDLDAVHRSVNHLDMMLLEVDLLTQQLRDASLPAARAAEAVARLVAIRAELEQVRRHL